MDNDRLRMLAGMDIPAELADNIRELEEAVDVEGATLEELRDRLAAASRGLGLANRLSGPSKKAHISRVFSNLNKIRNALHRMMQSEESLAGYDVEEIEPEQIDVEGLPTGGGPVR